MYKKLTILVVISILAGFTYAYDLKWRSALTFAPASPSAGDTVTFSCLLKSGDGPSNAVLIHLKVDGSMVNSVTVANMSIDEQKWIEITWTAVAGTHSVDMVIDPNDTISGENPDNNTRSTSITVASGGTPGPVDGPNLEILNVSWSPISYSKDSILTINYTVKNTGNGDATATKVGQFSDGTRIATQDIIPLASGAQQTRNINWLIRCGKKVELKADTNNIVSESDESDNNWERIFLCFAGTVSQQFQIVKLPDLRAKLIINPYPTVGGGKMGVTLRVTNRGKKDAAASVLAIQYGSHTPLTWPVPPLKPGEHHSIMDKQIVPSAGIYYITGYADYEGIITESDETNNKAFKKVPVKAPDLKFTNARVNKTNVLVQQKVKIWGTVRNVGKADAGPFEIQANFEPCKGIAQGYKIKSVPGLVIGGSVYFEFSHRFACLGTKDNYVLIDNKNEVIEKNEKNNITLKIKVHVNAIPLNYHYTGSYVDTTHG